MARSSTASAQTAPGTEPVAEGTAGRYRLAALGPETKDAFYRLHNDSCGAGWCRCVAWWVDSFDGWGQRTAAQNLALRESLFDRAVGDGYLLFDGNDPVAWCQVVKPDEPPNLASRFALPEDACRGARAISCVLIHPGHRRRGLARRMLSMVLEALTEQEIKAVYAYPKSSDDLEAGDLWNGPLALWIELGFESVRNDGARVLMVRSLMDDAAGSQPQHATPREGPGRHRATRPRSPSA